MILETDKILRPNRVPTKTRRIVAVVLVYYRTNSVSIAVVVVVGDFIAQLVR